MSPWQNPWQSCPEYPWQCPSALARRRVSRTAASGDGNDGLSSAHRHLNRCAELGFSAKGTPVNLRNKRPSTIRLPSDPFSICLPPLSTEANTHCTRFRAAESGSDPSPIRIPFLPLPKTPLPSSSLKWRRFKGDVSDPRPSDPSRVVMRTSSSNRPSGLTPPDPPTKNLTARSDTGGRPSGTGSKLSTANTSPEAPDPRDAPIWISDFERRRTEVNTLSKDGKGQQGLPAKETQAKAGKASS
mmetsp:Transcript_17920/g.32710  ORF Transcript_17920/g.32710 Transcript_17920/m.32710 type:complete len:243 (-) Transcript_17920:553-1281(-)